MVNKRTDSINNWQMMWSPGIPGGAQLYPVVCSVKEFGAEGDGVKSDSPAFEKAIESVPPTGGTVLIPKGRYLITEPLRIDKPAVLLGECRRESTLVFDFFNNPALSSIYISGESTNTSVEIISGFTKGSKVLFIEKSLDLKPGDYVELSQNNNAELMYTRPDWDTPWAKDSVGQIIRISDVQEAHIVLERPLLFSYSAHLYPRITVLNIIKGVGLKDLHLKRIDSGDGSMVSMDYAVNCWIDNCESEYASRAHAWITACLQCEIRNCSFHHAHQYGEGGHGYGVACGKHTSDCLIEKNVFYHLRHSMMVKEGACGNVFGYNFSKDSRSQTGSQLCDISLHGHYAYMNLFEGNDVEKIDVSDYWGPMGPGNTFFRNRIRSGGINVKDSSHYQNIIGNLLTTGDNVIKIDSTVKDLLLYANLQNGSVQWDGLPPQELPASLYIA